MECGLKMNNCPKCVVKEEKNRKFCSNGIVIEIKVTLYHPDSERKSHQNWFLCEKHFNRFIEDNGVGWYRWYSNKENFSHVIDYTVILYSEIIMNIPKKTTKDILKVNRIIIN